VIQGANPAARTPLWMRERLRRARERLYEDDAPVRALEAFLARAVEATRGS